MRGEPLDAFLEGAADAGNGRVDAPAVIPKFEATVCRSGVRIFGLTVAGPANLWCVRVEDELSLVLRVPEQWSRAPVEFSLAVYAKRLKPGDPLAAMETDSSSDHIDVGHVLV